MPAWGKRILGNDLIDLADPDTRDILENRRFLERVFTEGERDLIVAGPGPERRRVAWMFWAAKEAAYKALRPSNPSLVWSPRAFEIRSFSPRGAGDSVPRVGELSAGNGLLLRLAWEFTDEWVHAICTAWDLDGPDRTAVVPGLVAGVALRPAGLDESTAVRELALRLYAQSAGGTVPMIQAISGGIPRFFLGERELAMPLSLSHHGRFVAAAFLSPAE